MFWHVIIYKGLIPAYGSFSMIIKKDVSGINFYKLDNPLKVLKFKKNRGCKKVPKIILVTCIIFKRTIEHDIGHK